MDLKSLLNDDNGEADRSRPRHSSGSQSRSHTLPTLQTHSSIGDSPGVARSRTALEGQYPFPPQSSPGHSTRHHSSLDYQYAGASGYGTGSPAEAHPYTPGSAFVRNERASGSASLGQPLYRQISQPSQASTPSSQHGPTPHAGVQHSPIIQRQTSGYYAGTLSHPGTPLGPPLSQSPQSFYRSGPPLSGPPLNHSPQTFYRPGPGQPASPYGVSGPPPPTVQSRVPSHSSRDSAPPHHSMLTPGGHAMAIPSMSPPAPPASMLHPMQPPMTSYARPQQPRHSGTLGISHERSQSASVSPKTVVTDLPPSRKESVNGTGPGRFVGGTAQDPGSAHGMTPSSTRARSSSNTSGFLQDPTSQQKGRLPGSTDIRSSPLAPSSARTGVVAAPPLVSRSSKEDFPSSPEPSIGLKVEPSAMSSGVKRSLDSDPASSEQPPQKRRRGVDIPIWARRSKNTAPLPKYRPGGPMYHLLNATTNGGGQTQPPPTRPPQANAQAPLATYSAPPPQLDPCAPKLEPSFMDYTPFEDLHKVVCDFIYAHVVADQKFKTGGPTSDAMGNPEGTVEIEAKVGKLIDKNTGMRLMLPVQSEVVIHPSYDLAFESKMTEQQHRYFNDKLNDAVGRSHAPVPDLNGVPGVPRVKIQYQHRREIDSFYTLPPDEISSLPATIIPFMQRNAKLRVSKHQQTGEILAQIVKVRIGDLHIYSPLNDFDYRISISAECNWLGSIQRLMAEATMSGGKAQPDRHKDRMSYAHQYCNIDLTQVKPTAEATSDKATHELEVELDSDFTRRQGMLAGAGQPNKYEEVVKIFLNNVRLLIKRPPPQAPPPPHP